LLLFVFSCLSKAMAVPLPIVLLLIDYWQGREWLSVKNLVEKAGFFAIALLFGLISVNVQAGGDFHGFFTMEQKHQALSNPPFSGLERIAYPLFGYLKYHLMAILPFGLSNLHPYPVSGSATNSKYFLAIAFFIASIAVMLWSYRRKKYIFFGWGFFLVTIFLVLQFLSVGKAFMAERYSYLPYVGLFFMIFYGLDEYLKKPTLLLTIGSIFGIICLFLTTQQVKTWKDNFSLWSNAYKNYPNDNSILESMADEYGRQGQFDKVQEFGEKALAINTNSYHTYEILANVYALKKDILRSLQMYDKAISLDSTVGNVYYNRGVTLVESNPAKAIEDYNKSMSLPSHDRLYKIRGSRAYAYLKLNKFKEAIEDYTYVIENMDGNPGSYYADRGIAKFNLQDKAGAIADLKQAVSLDPSNQIAQENLKLVLSQK
jgi:protein O-mannosyl-transferase